MFVVVPFFATRKPFFYLVVGVGGKGKREERGWGRVDFLTLVADLKGSPVGSPPFLSSVAF